MLIIGKIKIDNVKFTRFGGPTRIENKILLINKGKFIKEARSRHPVISSLKVDIAKPGDKTRIIPVKDVVMPGLSEKKTLTYLRSVDFNFLKILDGVAVVTCGQIVGYQEGIIDMSGPGADYSSFSKLINIVLVPKVKKNTPKYEHEKTLRDLGIWAASYFVRIAIYKNHDETEFFYDLEEKKFNELPKIVYVYMVLAQGLLHDTYINGEDAKTLMPQKISHLDILSGAIISGNCVSACDKNTTYHHQNNEVIKELYRRHGKEINFSGVVIVPVKTTFSEKQECAEMAAKIISEIKPDGVIISKEGFGNPDADLMMICSKIEAMGIKTVCITDEYAGSDGASQSLADAHPSADAIISVGNANEKIILPAMKKTIGDASILENLAGGSPKSLRPDGSMEVELQVIIGATNQIGCERLSAKEI